MVIVGLCAKQRRLFAKENVIMLPRLEDAQALCALYASADVLLNPTYADTFPTVNLEAQACGCPVITYRTGGSPDSLNADTGIVVDRGDRSALRAAITAMKGKDRPRVRKACIQNAAGYETAAMLAAYAKLYDERMK